MDRTGLYTPRTSDEIAACLAAGYEIVDTGTGLRFHVVNKHSGEVVARYRTRKSAERQLEKALQWDAYELSQRHAREVA
jgi:hypothetical protein